MPAQRRRLAPAITPCKYVAIPLENVVVRNDQIVLQGLTAEQLKALPKFENTNNSYRELGDNENITLTEAR